MTSVGISGHQRLEKDETWAWVRSELTSLLAYVPPPIIGLSSLAIGADQLFAETVLTLGGEFEAVIPFSGYEETFQQGPARQRYLDLLSQARSQMILPGAPTREASYFQAGKRIVDACELLIVVWDGRPAKGLGGTGDIVAYARKVGRKTYHLNPILLEAKLDVH